MRTPPPAQSYLSLDELSPTVDLASCWQHASDRWFEYRIPSFHFLLVETGGIVNQTPTRRFKAQPGDLICFPPAEYNRYGTLGPTVVYESHITFAPPPRHRLGPWFDEAGPLRLCLPLRHAFGATRQVFETLCIELGHAGSAHRLRVRAAVYELLAIIAGLRKQRAAGAPVLDDWQRARLRLESEAGASLQVAQLAERMNVGADHFIRRFKQRFGVTPKVFQTHARLREAVRLLRSTGKGIKTIAYDVGFADSKSFLRTFKKHFGVVPSDLRLSRDPVPPMKSTESLYPINRHVFPPDAVPGYAERWQLPKR